MDDWETAVRCRASFVWHFGGDMWAGFPNSDQQTVLLRIGAATATGSVNGRELGRFGGAVRDELDAWARASRPDLIGLIPTESPPDALDLCFAGLVEEVGELYAGIGSPLAPVTLVLEQGVGMSDGFFVRGEFSRPLRTVRLIVDADHVDWRTVVACVPILMHELVCHAGAGHDTSGHQYFSEALMDLVAEAFVGRLGSKARFAIPPEQLLELNERMRTSRRQEGVYPVGRFARRALHRRIDRSPLRHGRDTDVLVDRLLLAINAHRGPVGPKDKLTKALAYNTLDTSVSEQLMTAALASRIKRSGLVAAVLASPHLG